MMSPFKNRLFSHCGFTLVELLVVLVLVGLISSLVFISVSSGLFKSKERRFVERFRNTMFRCRNMAIGRGRAVNFIIDGEKREFGIKDKAKEKIPKSIEIRGEGLVELSEGVYSIVFYPDGSSSGGEVELDWESGRKDFFKIGGIFANIDHEVSGT